MNLSPTDYLSLSPLLILLGTGMLLLLLECFTLKTTFVTIAGIIAALIASYYAPASTSSLLTPWLTFDAFSRFFALLFLSIGLVTVLISSPFFKRFEASRGEYYFFLLSSLFGLLLISSGNDFLTLFLGLETLSICLYVLCGYIKKWNISHEAAFKYFLLGSLSTSFLLFGIALIFGATGSTSFEKLHSTNDSLFLAGIGLITVSLLFKAAVVPFHVWAPDVYDGAPTPVTAFMAVGTKAGAFAALIRLFLLVMPQVDLLWHQAIAFLAYPTLIYANFVAMQQQQLRRFFAYSGISHAGFLLIPLAAGGPDAASSMLFYLVVYSIATLGCFAVLSLLDTKSEGVQLKDLNGLFYTSPLLASVLILCLLTLAGIPPTIGFFAKFYLLKVAFLANYYGLVVVGLLMTVFAAYYYLRIVTTLFAETAKHEVMHSKQSALCAFLSFASVIALSFFPDSLLAVIALCQT